MLAILENRVQLNIGYEPSRSANFVSAGPCSPAEGRAGLVIAADRRFEHVAR
jgi:hypothetical protein